jgi:arylsulfatase
MKATAFLDTFLKYPPSQRPATFSVDQVQEKVNKAMEEHFQQLDKQKAK